MSTPIAELNWLRACYEALWHHVNHDHGLRAEGTAGQIEAVHMRAHRYQGSAWHDAWTLPRPAELDAQQEAGR
jgi:hypothetical protein